MEMANGWRTKEEIEKLYGYSQSTFYDRRNECLALPEYRDAVILDGQQKTFIDENLWQKFLRYRSEKTRLKMLDPHLRPRKER